MSVFFVKPEERTVDLKYEAPDGSTHEFWIKLKARLTAGEERRVMTAGWTSVARAGGAETVIDFARQSLSRTEMYLTGWSFLDDDRKPVALAPAAIASLAPAVFDLIESAIAAHVSEMAQEKKARSGNSALSAKSA